MSENSGLQTLENVQREQPTVRIPRSYRIRDRTRVFKVNMEDQVLEQAARSKQRSLEDLRYCPVTRSQKHRRSYEPVKAPVYSEAIRRTFKKNKYRPSVSFIPETTLLEEQPALNIANPVYPQLGFNPLDEIPDLTVSNSLPENRQMRTSNRRLASMLDSRAIERSRARRVMRQINPDAPKIVDVQKHRQNHNNLRAAKSDVDLLTLQLAKKILFRQP